MMILRFDRFGGAALGSSKDRSGSVGGPSVDLEAGAGLRYLGRLVVGGARSAED